MNIMPNKQLRTCEYIESLGYTKVTQSPMGSSNGTYITRIGPNIINIVVDVYYIKVLLYIPTINDKLFEYCILQHHFAIHPPVYYLLKKGSKQKG